MRDETVGQVEEGVFHGEIGFRENPLKETARGFDDRA